MKPQEITLNRTGDRPATIKGLLEKTFSSSNATAADRDSSAKQWFVIDLYQTAAGTHVAHIQYRAGSAVGYEEPKDVVHTGQTLVELFDKIKLIDPVAEFLTSRAEISQKTTSEDARRSDRAHADIPHVIAIDLCGRHVMDRDGAGIHGVRQMAADEPDKRHEHEVRKNAAGAEDHRTAQSHYVPEPKDESDGVEAKHHARPII